MCVQFSLLLFLPYFQSRPFHEATWNGHMGWEQVHSAPLQCSRSICLPPTPTCHSAEGTNPLPTCWEKQQPPSSSSTTEGTGERTRKAATAPNNFSPSACSVLMGRESRALPRTVTCCFLPLHFFCSHSLFSQNEGDCMSSTCQVKVWGKGSGLLPPPPPPHP